MASVSGYEKELEIGIEEEEEDCSMDNILSCIHQASTSIRSVLNQPRKPKRRVNHKKYLQKQMIKCKGYVRERVTTNKTLSRCRKPDQLSEKAYDVDIKNLFDSPSSSPDSCVQLENQTSMLMRKVSPHDLNILSPASFSDSSCGSALDTYIGPEDDLDSLLSSPSWKQIVQTNNAVCQNKFQYDSYMPACAQPGSSDDNRLGSFVSPYDAQNKERYAKERAVTLPDSTQGDGFHPQIGHVYSYSSCMYDLSACENFDDGLGTLSYSQASLECSDGSFFKDCMYEDKTLCQDTYNYCGNNVNYFEYLPLN